MIITFPIISLNHEYISKQFLWDFGHLKSYMEHLCNLLQWECTILRDMYIGGVVWWARELRTALTPGFTKLDQIWGGGETEWERRVKVQFNDYPLPEDGTQRGTTGREEFDITQGIYFCTHFYTHLPIVHVKIYAVHTPTLAVVFNDTTWMRACVNGYVRVCMN